MSIYVLDTHALLWYLADDPRLGLRARAVLGDPEATLIIPAIVLAEAKDLAHKGRFDRTLEDVVAVIETDPRCLVYPIDLDVVKQAPASLDIHDSLVVGVALAQLAPVDGVITRDQEITSSGLVPAIW